MFKEIYIAYFWILFLLFCFNYWLNQMFVLLSQICGGIKLRNLHCHLENSVFPSTWVFHFLKHSLLVPMSCRLGFCCFDRPLLVADTIIVLHWKFILTLIQSLFEHWQQDYFGFISWLEMIPFGILIQNSFHKGTKAQGLKPESIELFFWIGTWEHKNCILHIDRMPLGWLQEHHSEGARLFWCEHNRSFYLS